MTSLTLDNFTGPWAGLPVAWDNADRLDLETYSRDVESCCRAGVPGVYTGGTTGEFYALEWEEFCQVTTQTVDICRNHDVPVMIGCTATSTHGAARRAAFAAKAGAVAIQVALPFWMEIAEDEITPFFSTVASAAESLALSVYETTRSKRTLTIDQHRAIKQALPSYLMVKSNAGTIGYEEEGCAALSSFVNVFAGEGRWPALASHGVRGCCSSMVYWNPAVTLEFWDHVARGNQEGIDRWNTPVEALFGFLHKEYGERGFTDTAFDRMGGLATGFLATSLHNRGPYRSPSEEDVAILRRWMEGNFPEMIVH